MAIYLNTHKTTTPPEAKVVTSECYDQFNMNFEPNSVLMANMISLQENISQLLQSLKDNNIVMDSLAELKGLLNKNQKALRKKKLYSVVESLRDLFATTENKDIENQTLSVVSILLTSETYCGVFGKPEPLKKLKEILMLPERKVDTRVCRVLGLLSEHPATCEMVHRLGFIPVLLENLTSYEETTDDNHAKEACIRALSQLCKHTLHWLDIKYHDGFCKIAKSGIKSTDDAVLLVTMRSLKHFHRHNRDFYNQLMTGTNSFGHLKDMLAKADVPEQARTIAEDLIMCLMRVKTSTESSPCFLKLFEAIESSNVTNYLLQSLFDPTNPENRRTRLLAFFSRLVSITWPAITRKINNINRGCSMMSQIKTKGVAAYVNLYNEHKHNHQLRAQCLSLLALYKTTDITIPLMHQDYMKFLVQLPSVYDECITYINSLECTPSSGCHHMDPGGLSLPEEEAMKKWMLRTLDEDEITHFKTCVTTIDSIWKIISQAISLMGTQAYEYEHWLDRLLLYYEKAPLVSSSAEPLLLALYDLPRSFDCIMDSDVIARLPQRNVKGSDPCRFCLKTQHATTNFLDLLEDKYLHNKVVHEELERRLQLPGTDPKRNRVLFTFPLIISCFKCSMYFYRKYDVITALTELLESTDEEKKKAAAALNTVLRRVKMFANDSPYRFRSALSFDPLFGLYQSQCAWENDTNKDLTINVGSSTFSVNRQKFASSSPVFSAMFMGSFIEGTSDVVTLTSFDENVFRHVVHGVYGCYCKTRRSGNVPSFISLMQICDMYELPILMDITVFRFGVLLLEPVVQSQEWDLTRCATFLPSLSQSNLEYLLMKVLLCSSEKEMSVQKMNFLALCLSCLGGMSYFCKAYYKCDDYMRVISSPSLQNGITHNYMF